MAFALVTKIYKLIYMKREEFYDLLSTFIDKNTINKDDENKKIFVDVPINPENIKDFRKNILTMFANPHIAYTDWDDNNIHTAYKFDSHYIDIDEQTIKYDNYGRLYTDVDTIITEKIKSDDNTSVVIDNILMRLQKYQTFRSLENILDILENKEIADKIKDIGVTLAENPMPLIDLINKLHEQLVPKV